MDNSLRCCASHVRHALRVDNDGRLQILFEVRAVKCKDSVSKTFEIAVAEDSRLKYVIAMLSIELAGGKGMRVPTFVYSVSDDASKEIALVIRVRTSNFTRSFEQHSSVLTSSILKT